MPKSSFLLTRAFRLRSRKNRSICSRLRSRNLLHELLEARQLLAVDWRNPVNSLDVSSDQRVSPLDALLVINELNKSGGHALPTEKTLGSPFWDTSGDQTISPIDALLVINLLNSRGVSEGSTPFDLRENSQISAQQSVTITVGQAAGTRSYRLQVTPNFDRSDTQSASSDMFAVYLVDPKHPDQTLLDRGMLGTSLFTLSETGAEYVPGLVRWDGQIAEVDLSGITNIDTAELRFQLLSNDNDTGSRVLFTPLTNEVDTEGIVGPKLSRSTGTTSGGPSFDLGGLSAANEVDVKVKNVRYDSSAKHYKAELRLQNQGASLGRSVAVVFPDLPNGVTLRNASGTTTTGKPYINFSPAIARGGLPKNGQSEPVLVEIDDPSSVPFALMTQVLASQNRAPQLAPIGPLTVKPGDTLLTQLNATDADGDLVTYSLSANQGSNAELTLPTSRLTGNGQLVFTPKPDQVGTYSFNVIASDGVLQSVQPVTLNVVADPVTSTRVSGIILDVDKTPLAGLQVEIGAVKGLTASDGSFSLDLGTGPIVSDTIKVRGETSVGSKVYPFIAEKLPLLLEHDVYQGHNNVVNRPIYLPSLDMANAVRIDPAHDTLVTTAALLGAEVNVKAGTLFNQQGTLFTGQLSITEVAAGLTPAALPANLYPDLVVTIQPGEMVFATPAPLTLPNSAGYPAGAVMDLWSINPSSGFFDKVGVGKVSIDGSVIETISGGIRNSSWHFFTPPPPTPEDPNKDDRNQDENCNKCESASRFHSEVELHSGALRESHELVGYHSLGETRALVLNYNSLRADPRPIVHFGYSNVVANDNLRLVAELTLSRGDIQYQVPGFELRRPEQTDAIDTHFAGTFDGLAGGQTPVNFSFTGTAGQTIVLDRIFGRSDIKVGCGRTGCSFLPITITLTDARGNQLFHDTINNSLANLLGETSPRIKLPVTGSYTITVSTQSRLGGGFGFDVKDVSNLQLIGSEHFFSIPTSGGTIDAALQADLRSQPSGQYDYKLSTGLRQFNPLGLAGSSTINNGKLVNINAIDSSFGAGWELAGLQSIVENPDGSLLLIDGDGTNLIFSPPLRNNGPFVSPAGDFTTLVRRTDGTFQRTTKEQTIYAFNSARQLATMTDRNGNRTEYVYDSSNRLISIVDPVGLATTFTYSGNRISSIKDPASRVTQLEYDSAGNLIQIIDPDASTRRFEYDTVHHLTAEIDQRNNREETTYDFAGRVKQGMRKDGTVMQLSPVHVQGLHPTAGTIDPFHAPIAIALDAPSASFAEGNGNVERTLLDKAGQLISSADVGGPLPTAQRNSNNLVTASTDARGNLTFLSYDPKGNLVSVKDSIALSAANGSLFPGQTFDVGSSPSSMTMGDVDGDGDLDIVASNSNSVSVLRGDGLGGFAARTDIAVGSSPVSVTLGDVDDDGNPDIIAANAGSASVSVLRGDGLGGFAARTDFTVGSSPFSVMLGDVDGDGDLDIVAANRDDNSVSVLLGDGLGGFVARTDFTVGSSPVSVTLGDVDGDSDLDIVAANYRGDSVSVLRGDGLGGFATHADFAVGSFPRSVTLGDVNGDGKLDILTANGDSVSVSVLLGDGLVGFAGRTEFTVGGIPQSGTLGDMNSDGKLDIITAIYENGISVLLGDGRGGFAGHRDFAVGSIVNRVSLGDVDGDGSLDIVASNIAGGVSLVRGDGLGGVAARTDYAVGFNDVTLGDLNGDGVLDIVAANDNSVSVSRGDGLGGFAGRTDFAVRFTPQAITLGDVNGDGKLDIATANGDSVSVLLGDGLGGFAGRTDFTVGNTPQSVTLGDVNGDAKLDIVTANYNSHNVTVLRGDGLGGFAARTDFAVGSNPRSVTLGDVNGDGKLDIVAANYVGNSVSVLRGNGLGMFATHTDFALGSFPRSVTLGDVNADGALDIVVAAISNSGGSVSVLRGDGQGGFAGQREFAVDFPESVTLGDLDGDGDLDIVTANYDGSASVLRGDGLGGFAGRTNFAVSRLTKSVTLGDVNRDGILDIVTNGNKVSVLLARPGTQHRFAYDQIFNQLSRESDELGHQTVNDIAPANGNIRSVTSVVGAIGGSDDLVTRFTYTPQGLIDTATDPMGRITDYDYDSFGRMMQVTIAKGTVDEAVQKFEYDAAGNLTAFTDEIGNKTGYTYDARNRVISITQTDPDGAGPLNAPVTTFTYDAAGNLLTTTDANGHISKNVYDSMDRVIESIDANGQSTRFGYDVVGNQVSVIDPLGHTTRNRYDARSRLVETIDPNGASTKFAYDFDNNLVRVTDPVGNVTRFAYDPRNRLTKETDPLGKVIRYDYDAVNNLISKTDRNDRKIKYDYDELNRLTTETWVASGTLTPNVIHYSRDKGSNLLSATDTYSSLAFTYDNRNRVTSVDNADTPDAPPVKLAYAYDDVGNVLSVADMISGLAAGLNQYAYDALNRMTQIKQSGASVSDKRVDLTYNPLGQFASINRYADLTGTQLVVGSTFVYDSLNRLTSLTHANSTSTVAFYNFTYDTASRISKITDIDGITNYSYDKRDQLIGADTTVTSRQDETYVYDANGNRKSSSIHGSGYVTGPGNRLFSDGTFNYKYDNEGNLILRTEIATSNFREFQWDFRNRLVAVIDKSSSGTPTQSVEFSYDAINRRISKSVDTTPLDTVEPTVSHFVYDRDDVFLDFVDSDGSGPNPAVLEKRYLHGPAVDQVLAQENRTGNINWSLTDHLGSVRDLADPSGLIVKHIVYNSFGIAVDIASASVDTRYSFNGREFDTEIGLYYYRSRYYDASTSRFAEEDALRFGGGDTNLFSYVGNGPISRRDSSGFSYTDIGSDVLGLPLFGDIGLVTGAIEVADEMLKGNNFQAAAEFSATLASELLSPQHLVGASAHFLKFAVRANLALAIGQLAISVTATLLEESIERKEAQTADLNRRTLRYKHFDKELRNHVNGPFRGDYENRKALADLYEKYGLDPQLAYCDG